MKNIFIAAAIIVIAILGYIMFTKSSSNPNVEDNAGTNSAKLDMNVVCESALAYMSFPDAASAELFVEECKEGKHPQVIEQYKAQMNISDDTAI